VGTRKISQLDTISDGNISGEAILPIVVSDPLIPNRKAKINQLFKGVAQGTKDNPGLSFDLDRDTGLYQNAYDQFGISFGDGGVYFTRVVNTATSSSLFLTAVDDTRSNADLVLAPKGTGSVKVTGQFLIGDSTFILEDTLGAKVKFEVSTVGVGATTRTLNIPPITTGSITTLVGTDTNQTLTNKTILIDEDNFIIVDGQDEAIFGLNFGPSQEQRRTYFLPDAGPVTTTLEPTATVSTLLDTKAEQIVVSKTLVDLKLTSSDDPEEYWAQFNTDALTADRTITIPDLSLTLVGTSTNQVLQNKTVETLILQDPADNTKKATFTVANQNPLSNRLFAFPPTTSLNTTVSDTNIIITELSAQTLSNKKLVRQKMVDAISSLFGITIRTDNITADRVIRFPDADATLLSTSNVTLDNVTFGAGIGAKTLVGRTRLQQFFYAGF